MYDQEMARQTSGITGIAHIEAKQQVKALPASETDVQRNEPKRPKLNAFNPAALIFRLKINGIDRVALWDRNGEINELEEEAQADRMWICSVCRANRQHWRSISWTIT